MRAPHFWQHGAGGWRARLLAPLGRIYGAATLARLRQSGIRAPFPVVSIGNFTVGGAGKTPTALALAQALIERGERPAFVTRGYGGSEAGPLRVDPALHDAGMVGDEALLLARCAPTIIARRRPEALPLVREADASCLILDDALQNPTLNKDFSLAVIDGGFGFGNGHCLPAGPLRAPVDPMLAHVDAVLVLGEERTGAAAGCAGRVPIHAGTLRPDALAAAALAGHKVLGFCGIGRPEKFRETLEQTGAVIAGFRAFADHHRFSETEAADLLAEAMMTGTRLVTTEKDHVRLAGSPARARLAEAAQVLPVRVDLPDALVEAVYSALVSARRRLRTAAGPA